MKKCNKCGVILNDSNWSKSCKNHKGPEYICKICKSIQVKTWHFIHPGYKLRKKYYNNGFIDYKKIQNLKDKQDNRCYVCGTKEENKSFHIDHDHQTGKIRGWACPDCNVGFISGLDFLIKNKPEILDDLLKSSFIKNILKNPPGDSLYEKS